MHARTGNHRTMQRPPEIRGKAKNYNEINRITMHKTMQHAEKSATYIYIY
ncbi:MAG: hypothetical protein OXC91_00710 [Rhodobacteraceae bacterium]|nr:hypothetical protein [Paracoccaceae bacterium]